MDEIVTLAGALVVALVAGLGALARQHLDPSRGRAADDDPPELGESPTADRCREAARWFLRRGRLAEAHELFVRAGEPARAALVASKLGDHRLAGELYESAGDLLRAAAAFELGGMGCKARELRAAGQFAEAPTTRYVAVVVAPPAPIARADAAAPARPTTPRGDDADRPRPRRAFQDSWEFLTSDDGSFGDAPAARPETRRPPRPLAVSVTRRYVPSSLPPPN